MDRHQLGNRQFIAGRRHHQEISSFRQGKDEPGGSVQLPLPPSIHNFPDGVCQLLVGQAGFGLSRIEDLHRYSLAASRSGENGSIGCRVEPSSLSVPPASNTSRSRGSRRASRGTSPTEPVEAKRLVSPVVTAWRTPSIFHWSPCSASS